MRRSLHVLVLATAVLLAGCRDSGSSIAGKLAAAVFRPAVELQRCAMLTQSTFRSVDPVAAPAIPQPVKAAPSAPIAGAESDAPSLSLPEPRPVALTASALRPRPQPRHVHVFYAKSFRRGPAVPVMVRSPRAASTTPRCEAESLGAFKG